MISPVSPPGLGLDPAKAFETPVALFVFNRPEQTRRVFAEVAKLRPRTLLVVADGHREGRAGEAERCREVRQIVEAVNWDCTVLREYAPRNLGCRRRVSSGLDWVFSQCEEAIILEDDCLPDPTFFRFCAENLARYREDERVMMVSGDNFVPADRLSRSSYRFTRYNLIWGWASWRRAWRHYDVEMTAWPGRAESDWLRRITGSSASSRYWSDVFSRVYRGEIDTWDYQWMFASWNRDGIAIVPNVNLVTNIGFDADATHTTEENRLANWPLRAMEFPLRHPPRRLPDRAADRYLADRVFEWRIPSRGQRLYSASRTRLSSLVPGRVRRTLRGLLERLDRGESDGEGDFSS
jgi:hypothetical protein